MKGLVIAGPTGVGKTELSIKLAKALDLEIISVDSMQIYKEMNIGTAKISIDEMNHVKHHMIDIISPIDSYSVGDFEIDVNKILNEKQENVMLVGGTGLYIDAITNGISNLPSRDDKLRKELESKTIDELQNILKELDIDSFNEIDINNKVRLVRAVEVCMLSGQKFSILKKLNVKGNNYDYLKILLIRNRDELYDRINQRVDIMLQNGLLDEVKKLYEKYKGSTHKINAIGYKELFSYLEKEISLDTAIDKIKQESRRYAKRQLTWFRKSNDYNIYNLSSLDEEIVFNDILLKWKE